ncbi:MAG: hypothetical protein NT067_07365 [Candidatus Diapherotrites archaeon]|nr:hypothetical protein [Candidatus Diapherotrites archaeon]
MLESLKAAVRKDILIAALGLFFCTLAWAFFLNASGLSWQDFLEPSIGSLKAKIININFYCFLAFFTLSLAFSCFAAFKMPAKNAVLVILAGSVPAMALAFLTFPLIAAYKFMLAFHVLALCALAFTVSIKLTEIKKFTRLRSFSAGIGTFTLVLAIGFFIVGVLEIMPDQQKYIGKIENTLSSGIAGGDLQEKIIGANFKSQYNLLWVIHSSPQYQALGDLEDPKVVNFRDYFIKTIGAVYDASENPAKIIADNNIAASQGALDTHSLLESSVPGYGLFSKYFFILYPFMLFTVVISICNIVFRVLGVVFALLLASIFKDTQ